MDITRRDFVNGVLAGSGAALLTPRPALPFAGSAPNRVGDDWYGYGGTGDYAPSHGNTPEAVNTAHRLRDGEFAGIPSGIRIDEEFDLVIVGGGMSGLGAAWHFRKNARAGQSCLVLDNHPVFGGEAKENEFIVDGASLLGPQGSNGFFMPPQADDPEQARGDARYYAEFNIPRDLEYAPWPSGLKPLKFCRDNFGNLYWLTEANANVGHYFETGGKARWATDIWQSRLRNAPISDRQRQSLLAWYDARSENLGGDEDMRRLDTMSYKDYLERELKLGPDGAAEADLFLAGAFGLGSDSISAYLAYTLQMPGMLTQEMMDAGMPRRHSFPGGNSGFARYFLKAIKPDAIAGQSRFDDIITGAIDFDALDRPGDAVRFRLPATAVAIEHEKGAGNGVRVVYLRGGRLHAVRARGVVMASGGWINRHVLRDLPERFHQAYGQFHHAPMLVANVALSNWRFMYELGITAARWRQESEFGLACNIRQPMLAGRHRPELHPDKPAVLTFYVPFHSPGLSVEAQVAKGRAELFHTSYASYEERIRKQLTRLFADSGFDHRRDIRGIILNRWGHAYVVPGPGFFFDTADRQAPRNIIRQGYGRIAFGHSELEGFQHWGPAADQGRRAMQQMLDVISVNPGA